PLEFLVSQLCGVHELSARAGPTIFQIIGFQIPQGPSKRQMADGGWQMADGGWRMADGKWQMADGRWHIPRDRQHPALSSVPHSAFRIPHSLDLEAGDHVLES